MWAASSHKLVLKKAENFPPLSMAWGGKPSFQHDHFLGSTWGNTLELNLHLIPFGRTYEVNIFLASLHCGYKT